MLWVLEIHGMLCSADCFQSEAAAKRWAETWYEADRAAWRYDGDEPFQGNIKVIPLQVWTDQQVEEECK